MSTPRRTAASADGAKSVAAAYARRRDAKSTVRRRASRAVVLRRARARAPMVAVVCARRVRRRKSWRGVRCRRDRFGCSRVFEARRRCLFLDATRSFRVVRLMCRTRPVGENNSQPVFVASLDRIARVDRRASYVDDEALMKFQQTVDSSKNARGARSWVSV